MRVWQYSGIGHVRLKDGYIEVVHDHYTERPQRLRCGLIVFTRPQLFPHQLKRLVRQAFDDLWFKERPAPNDLLPKITPSPVRKNPLALLWR